MLHNTSETIRARQTKENIRHDTLRFACPVVTIKQHVKQHVLLTINPDPMLRICRFGSYSPTRWKGLVECSRWKCRTSLQYQKAACGGPRQRHSFLS